MDTSAKSFGALELEYHSDRLLYPIKRVGKRGEGKWERISWDEALSTIADKLNQMKKETGAESVVFAHGTVGIFTDLSTEWPISLALPM
ncbi:MAG: molybdopterin-dependent oxidoreductase [Nitrososphaerota archaeon]|nr:molybdopterin-dependent oxidoreductase [Nitrososphaerota archaeon]